MCWIRWGESVTITRLDPANPWCQNGGSDEAAVLAVEREIIRVHPAFSYSQIIPKFFPFHPVDDFFPLEIFLPSDLVSSHWSRCITVTFDFCKVEQAKLSILKADMQHLGVIGMMFQFSWQNITLLLHGYCCHVLSCDLNLDWNLNVPQFSV